MIISKPKVVFVIFDNYEYERMGIQILSSIATEEGFERSLLILNSVSTEDAMESIKRLQPEIIAYSAMTFEQVELQKFNRLLKSSGLKFISIFGGSHYTFSPEEIYNDASIDVVCRGEGEIAFRSFIRAVRDGQEYHNIEKLWVRREGKIIENPIGSLISDLDLVSFPDRELIPLNIQKGQLVGNGMKVIIARGCPNQCTYCFNSQWNKLFQGSRICRHRSVENVIKEIKQILAKHDLDYIMFGDDNFNTLPLDFIQKFCERYKKEIGLPFAAPFRAEFVTEDLLVLLKDAGLFFGGMGIECGDEDIARNFLKRGNITNDSIIKAFDLFHKHKITVVSSNISALPVKDPLAVDLKTIKLNIRCKPSWANFAILLPIPKTEIWKSAIENNYLRKDAFSESKKPPSVFISTTLNFDPKLANKLNNLHKFASIAVKFPFLLPVIMILIKLPQNRLYQYINFLWYGYWGTAGLFKVKLSPALIVRGVRKIHTYIKKY